VVVVAIILVVNVVTQNGNESDYLEDTTTTFTTIDEYIQDEEETEPLEETEEELDEDEEDTIEETEPPQSDYITYTFRNDDLLNSHYEKHGIEMGFASAEEYLASANEVINNPNALHKLEAEDNDDVYYLEDTQEFVIVSTDGYIRTYYYASLDYYNRQ
jgi:pyocin large subunit-like protein